MSERLSYLERLKVYQAIPGPTQVEMSESELRAYVEFLEGRDLAEDLIRQGIAIQNESLDGWEESLAALRRLQDAQRWVFALGAVFGGGLVGAVWSVLQ